MTGPNGRGALGDRVPPPWLRRAAWIGLAVAVLGMSAIRVRLLDVPLERDEGEYAYIGSLLLDGVPPYAAAYTMKLPGTPAMYALAMAGFGRNVAAIRIGLLAVTGATAVLLFLLARRLLGALGALAAVVTFACLSIAPALLGTHAHATHFVSLAGVAGLLTLAAATAPARSARLFVAGVLLGAAILMKQSGAVFAAFGFWWIAWTWWSTQPRGWRALATRVLPLAAGVFTPLVATAFALWMSGTFAASWFWTVRYARQYATSIPLSAGLTALETRLAAMVPSLSAFGVLATASTAALLTRRPRTRARAYVAGLSIFSAVGVVAGMYLRPHYFLLLAPAAALVVGLGAEEAYARASSSLARRATLTTIGAAVALAAGQSLWTEREVLFTATPTAVSRALYRASPFPEAIEIGRYVREHTRPTETVAVLGSEPEIFFYAGRRSASKHIHVYWLMESHSLARAMQADMISEIERARPRYVVYVRTDGSWNRSVFSERLVFDWLATYLPAYYTRVGQVDIRGPRDTRYLWDADVTNAAVTPYTHVIVLRRTE